VPSGGTKKQKKEHFLATLQVEIISVRIFLSTGTGKNGKMKGLEVIL